MSDLTKQEQANVRTALVFLRARCGGVKALVKALRLTQPTLWRPASVLVAFRVAKLAGVGVDDVLTGKFPPAGTCPHCGHVAVYPLGDNLRGITTGGAVDSRSGT